MKPERNQIVKINVESSYGTHVYCISEALLEK